MVKRYRSSGKPARFALLIPAHDEAHAIETILKSIHQITYPREQFDCYFVADHCTDSTAELIKAQGFQCYEKNDGQRGKGKALDWLITRIRQERPGYYDAFVFFDADNWVTPGFLVAMNDCLNAGNGIIQGNVGILNWYETPFLKMNQINIATSNRLRENGRSNLGLSSRLKGHGMCFSAGEIDNFNFSTDSIVEDLDLYLQVLGKDKRVAWAHQAKVFSVMPNDVRTSRVQRLRWASGKNEMLKHNVQLLLQNIRQQKTVASVDAFIDLVLPSNAVLTGIALLIGAAGVIFSHKNFPVMVWSLALIAAYAGYFALGALLEKIPMRMIISVLASPQYILWRLWIYFKSFKKQVEWR
jgi:cellulose synthase/poly-beta-1,6-N-acetylglucosamine synthase-like glycosyltransferase